MAVNWRDMPPPSAEPGVAIHFTPKLALKTSLASGLIAAGMYYMISGRKNADLNRMITGAVLTLASLLLFL